MSDIHKINTIAGLRREIVKCRKFLTYTEEWIESDLPDKQSALNDHFEHYRQLRLLLLEYKIEQRLTAKAILADLNNPTLFEIPERIIHRATLDVRYGTMSIGKKIKALSTLDHALFYCIRQRIMG